MKLTAKELLKMKIIDEIIKEPTGGAHRNKESLIISVKEALTKYLEEFKNFSREEIFEQRQEKFLGIGKQKAFTVFSKDTAWIKENNFLTFVKENLLKYKKQSIILAAIILVATFFLI